MHAPRCRLVVLCRALKVATSAYVDNAVDMFHGITRLDMAALADPGAASHEATVKFKKSFGETKAAGRVHKSMLEPLGPPEVNLKGKLLAEGVEFPPVPGADPRPCAWAAAETSLTVSLSLSAPLFPPWEPPPKPVNTLEEMVPKRCAPRFAGRLAVQSTPPTRGQLFKGNDRPCTPLNARLAVVISHPVLREAEQCLARACLQQSGEDC